MPEIGIDLIEPVLLNSDTIAKSEFYPPTKQPLVRVRQGEQEQVVDEVIMLGEYVRIWTRILMQVGDTMTITHCDPLMQNKYLIKSRTRATGTEWDYTSDTVYNYKVQVIDTPND